MLLDVEQRQNEIIVSYYNTEGTVSFKRYPIAQFKNWYITQESDRWECVVGLSPLDEFSQVSFVNGIYTPKGGKHVDFVTKQITNGLAKMIQKKNKKKIMKEGSKEIAIIYI